jgi:hypothetical protein
MKTFRVRNHNFTRPLAAHDVTWRVMRFEWPGVPVALEDLSPATTPVVDILLMNTIARNRTGVAPHVLQMHISYSNVIMYVLVANDGTRDTWEGHVEQYPHWHFNIVTDLLHTRAHSFSLTELR